MSALIDARVDFSKCISSLVQWANTQPGWKVAYGRDFDEKNESLRHMKGSNHYVGLANDLALYITDPVRGWVDRYQESTEAYRALGAIWKDMHPLARWGGDFKKADGNHFSFIFNGRA